jgi:hypothetical protein
MESPPLRGLVPVDADHVDVVADDQTLDAILRPDHKCSGVETDG